VLAYQACGFAGQSWGGRRSLDLWELLGLTVIELFYDQLAIRIQQEADRLWLKPGCVQYLILVTENRRTKEITGINTTFSNPNTFSPPLIPLIP
jgi:hypothetical protein